MADTLNGVQVTPHDVGVGLSQLIPVVVAALDRAGEFGDAKLGDVGARIIVEEIGHEVF